MRSAVVYLSSICPECKSTSTMPFTRLEIAELLLSDKPFVLYSGCHNISWAATESDRRQLFSLIRPSDVILPAAPAAQTATPLSDLNASRAEAIARLNPVAH